MRKLLLTLLGVMVLCGLSPHAAQAQDTKQATLDDGTPVIDVTKASALTTALDGELVRLQFPVNVLASGTMDGSTKCKYMIYGRDPENNPVVMMSKVAAAPDSEDGYVPGAAFKAPADTYWTSAVFIPTSGVVGKAVAENGHLIIVIKDEDQNIDNSKYCYQDAAKKYSVAEIISALAPSNNILYALKANTHYRVDNITAADYGRMVWIRDVSYVSTSKTFTNKNDEEIPVKLSATDGYISATTYKMYTGTLKSNTSHGYSICGIVELDADGNPYIMLRNCISMVTTPEVTLNQPTTQTIEQKLTENNEKTAGWATIYRENNVPTITFTAKIGSATNQSIYWYTLDNGTESFVTSTSSKSVSGTFKNGICDIHISGLPVAYATSKNPIPSDRSEYILTVTDLIQSATPYQSLAEIVAAQPEENSVVSSTTKYFQYYNLPYTPASGGDTKYKDDNWPLANGMVAYLRGKYMLVREIARNEDGSLASLQREAAPFYILKRDSWVNVNSVTVDHSGGTTGGMSLSKRTVAEGDGVAKIAGIMTYENNNSVINLNQSYTPTGTSHQLKSTPTDIYFTLQFEGNATSIPPALFADQLEEWRISSVISNAAETTLDASYVGKVVEIKGASIAKDGETYTIGLKQPVAMSWFEGDAEMAKQQAVLAAADADAMFTLSGYVMNDGQGGVEIKLLSLDNTGEIIEVCEHPGHDSYYGDLSLDAYDGKVITLTGARIYHNDADDKYYTPVGSGNISFEWTTNPDGETTDKDAIKETSTDLNRSDNRFASAMLHDISAKVKKDGDSYTLDILSIKALSALNADEFGPDDLNVYVNGNLAKNNHTIGTAVYRQAITDFVKLTAQTPEWSDAVYAIVEENGTKIDNPVWTPLEAGKEMKIDHPMELYVTACNHGHKTQSVRRLRFDRSTHVATVGNLSELIDYEETGTDPATQNTHLLMTGTARVVAASVVNGAPVAVVTDNDGNHYLLRSKKADAELPEVGTMISNFAAERILDGGEGIADINTAYTANLNHDFADYAFTPDPDEELPALTPIAITNEHSTANAEKHIRLYDAKISADASGLTVTAGTGSIRLNNVFGCEIDGDDEDAQYVMTGIMLPRQGKRVSRQAAQQDVMPLADGELTLDDMEFLPLSIEKRRATAAPVYRLEGYESFENGLAVTVADVELTMECDEPYSAVSYSLDGGDSWTVYDGTPVKITESKSVSIKSSVLGFDDTTVSFEIRREYYSTEAKITPAAKGGYTEVVITPATEGLAADSYKIYYTTDGTEPTIESALYTAPVECDKAATVRALVVENDKRPGKASDPVAVSVRANDLDISVEKGEGFSTVTIAPKDAKHVDPKAEIRYTTDGTEPTAQSTLYTTPFEVEAADNGMTVKAICIELQKTDGLVATQTVAVEGLRPSCDVAITWREEDGVYYITLTAEAGTIRYSLNGADEKVYDGTPIEYTPATDGTCTVKAYAIEDGKKAGKTATESFQVSGIAGIGADGEADGVSVEGNTIIVPQGAQTFDIAGRHVNPASLPRGIYIVRLASGKAVKVVVK